MTKGYRSTNTLLSDNRLANRLVSDCSFVEAFIQFGCVFPILKGREYIMDFEYTVEPCSTLVDSVVLPVFWRWAEVEGRTGFVKSRLILREIARDWNKKSSRWHEQNS